MRNWDEEVIRDYIEACFEEQNEGTAVSLRHDPFWEAHMFEEYPITASIGFLKIPIKTRKKIKPIFFIGEKSDICNSKANKWVKLFFPNLKWIVIPQGSHMFPLEKQAETISIVKMNT